MVTATKNGFTIEGTVEEIRALIGGAPPIKVEEERPAISRRKPRRAVHTRRRWGARQKKARMKMGYVVKTAEWVLAQFAGPVTHLSRLELIERARVAIENAGESEVYTSTGSRVRFAIQKLIEEGKLVQTEVGAKVGSRAKGKLRRS